MDLWGPYKTPTLDRKYYFLTIVYDYSRFVWVHLLQLKSETIVAIKNFFSMINTSSILMSKLWDQTMAQSSLIHNVEIYSIIWEYYIRVVVLTHHNKMVWFKENTDTFLILQEQSDFKLIYLSDFGVTTLRLLCIWWIDYLHQPTPTKVPMSYFIVNNLVCLI